LQVFLSDMLEFDQLSDQRLKLREIRANAPRTPAAMRPADNTAVLARVRQAGEAFKAKVLAQPDMLSAEDAAGKVGKSRQTINDQRLAGKIIGLSFGSDRFRYPEWQFHDNVYGKPLEAALEALGHADAWEKWRFFTTEDGMLHFHEFVRRELAPRDQHVLRSAFEALLANNLAQPRVFVHRDYHSRNLMLSDPLPGVLDFQDAVYGPITYDLVSLLRDAYVRWEEPQVLDWVVRYWEKARRAGLPVPADFAAFYRDFEWMGAQRQLKVAGIFARLCHRDGKARYLADIPLVLEYLLATCRRYRELAPLARLLDHLAST